MNAPTTSLFAAPSTLAAISEAHAVAILIGSYDGSGNYGDIAQLDATLAMLGRFEPGMLLLPVLERSFAEGHRDLTTDFLNPPDNALFFDPGGDQQDGLLPVGSPPNLAFGACYLYGGGYLNRNWGERKLAMLHAAEALLAETDAREICRLSSGLQIEADWVADLDERDANALRSFELIGVRDSASGTAAAALGTDARILETADDAVGVLRGYSPQETTPQAVSEVYVNLHFAEHEWVSPRPEAALGFYVGFLAELQRRLGCPVVAQPLIAYLDGRIDERPAVGRLADSLEKQGVRLAQPLVLRPSAVPGALPDLQRASLTLSMSYHVALTSLLLGVPAALLRDNAYYEQKATALADAFDLPKAFALDSAADPLAAAAEIAAVALDPQDGQALRWRIAVCATSLRERRASAEAELLALLGSAATRTLTERLGELDGRLRERSAEPARLLAQIARLQTENGEDPVAEPAEPTEDDAARQMLAVIFESRTWRMTAPMRKLGASLRRIRAKVARGRG